MAEVKWRPQALRDLEAIEGYYEKVAPDFARVFVVGVFDATKRLGEYPESGRVVPELGEATIREVLYRRFRIVYVIGQQSVEILTVFHSSQEFGQTE